VRLKNREHVCTMRVRPLGKATSFLYWYDPTVYANSTLLPHSCITEKPYRQRQGTNRKLSATEWSNRSVRIELPDKKGRATNWAETV